MSDWSDFSAGQSHPGQLSAGQSHPGQLYAGQSHTGQLSAGQSYTGHSYTGQSHLGSSHSGYSPTADLHNSHSYISHSVYPSQTSTHLGSQSSVNPGYSSGNHQTSYTSYSHGSYTGSFSTFSPHSGTHSPAGHHRAVLHSDSVNIDSYGQIYWDGRYKGDLDGIYIRNSHHEIVAKYVCNHVWLRSGDHYVDVGYAKNAQDAVYRICTQYRAMGNW